MLEIRINSDIQPEGSSNVYSVTNEIVSKYLTTIMKFQPALPEPLKILNPYAIFILTDFFCADNVFEEIQDQTSYDQRYLPCFMHRFLEFYTVNHPRTITFYFEFMESFQIPKHKLELETLPQVNSTTLKKLARNHSRMFEF